MDSPFNNTQRIYEDGLIVTNQSNKVFPEVVSPGGQQHIPSQSPNPPSESTYYQPSEFRPTNSDTPKHKSISRKRSTWIVVGLLIAVAVLAGVLGGVASGSIKTKDNGAIQKDAISTATGNPHSSISSSGSISRTELEFSSIPEASSPPTRASTKKTSSSTTAAPPLNPSLETITRETDGGTVTIECPSADGLDYTIVKDNGEKLTFKRYCDTNFPGGDIGKAENKSILSMPQCLDQCVRTNGCVGVVFNTGAQCWIKSSIGKKDENVAGTESAVLLQ